MPPPSTNRTFWFNASDNDKLFLNDDLTGGNPTDGQSAKSWDDEDAGAEFFNEATNPPIWVSNGINGLGSLDFDGTNDIYTNQGGASSTMVNIISASAFTVFVSFYMEGAADNQANIYDNVGLVAETGDFWGLHLKSNAGVHTIHGYNWDTNADEVSKTIDLNTKYVVMFRHESGNIYISINQGSETSVASGDTGNLTNGFRPALPSSGSVFYNGRIGEILCYDAALTGSSFTDAYTYMMDKWVSTAAGVLIPKVMFMKRRRPMSRARRPG